MQRNKILFFIFIAGVIISISGYFILGTNLLSNLEGDVMQSQNVEIKDGVQYVTVTAKGGYSPRNTQLEAGMPTKLVIKTESTYDCSAALIVRSASFQKLLQPTGEEVIDLGIPKPGEKVQGTCSMGMYNFSINFN
ncbi:MAG: hypothetical protein N2558_00105 [Patescibacteria group bacterium]|nr:hypothetical protein [Patescibacteria group bacterium]